MNTLQKAETLLGRMLQDVRSSTEKLLSCKAHALYPKSIVVTSEAFENGTPIPRTYTQDGENISPPLSWQKVGHNVAELILVCEDPDAPMAQPYVHWIIYHIPPGTTSLPEHAPAIVNLWDPAGATQSRNSAKKPGYLGPKPPLGHGVHHYHFQLFGLDQRINVDDQPTKEDLLKAMEGHVVEEGELIGTYERFA